MVEIAVLGISSLLNILLGAMVYLKNPKSATNKLFLMLTLSFVLWSMVSYLSVHPVVFAQVTWVRLVLFCAAFLCLSVFMTFTVFPSYEMVGSRKIRKFAIVSTLVVMALTLTPVIFKASEDNKPVPNFGIPLFSLLVIGLLGGGIVTLAKKYRHGNLTQRQQLRIVILGLGGTFGLILLTNFVFFIAFNYTGLIAVAPAYPLIFIFALAYAIARHKLFDIRLLVAKSLAYILLVATLASLYTVVVFGLATRVFAENSVFVQQVFPIVTALFIAATAPFFKKLFDKVTNQFFYRDAYDPQMFLDQLNKAIVGNIELGILLRQTTEIIQNNLKCEICLIGVRETDTTPFRIIGSTGPSFKVLDMQFVSKELRAIGRKVTITDELPSAHDKLKKLLNDDNIAIICSLSSSRVHDPATAYLILGHKKSGNIYSKQDLGIIEIIGDELVIAIQNALRFEEIQSFAITLQNKVNEATAKLRHTNAKLKEMDETKDEFISMASHQLRTPLTSVKGYLSMALDGDAGKLTKNQTDLLEQAFSSSQRMVYLIADLLNVSRLKTGKFVIDAVPTNLAKVVETEVAQLTDTAKMKDIKLAFKKPADFPTLMLDETKIRQVIMNFADNALYYTPAGGEVTIELRDDRNRIYLLVRDTGMGVPKAEQEHLFGKFYRATNAQKARPDGTGLGLFMAKKVVAAQGGDILFESHEGKGSTFGFSFEKAKLQPSKESQKTK